MKILAYSDINSWNGFKEIIHDTKPDILILNGDLFEVNDKLIKKHLKDFYDVLKYASKVCKKVLLVKGNHDQEHYNIKLIESIPNCIDLSGKKLIIEGLTFFGLGYEHSHYLRILRPLLPTIQADILITHSDNVRLPILASTNPRLIIQGHCDMYKRFIKNVPLIITDHQINLIKIDSIDNNKTLKLSNQVICHVSYTKAENDLLENKNKENCNYCGNSYWFLKTKKEKHDKTCKFKERLI